MSYRTLGRQVSSPKEKITINCNKEYGGITLDDKADHIIRDTIISSDTIAQFQDCTHGSFHNTVIYIYIYSFGFFALKILLKS